MKSIKSLTRAQWLVYGTFAAILAAALVLFLYCFTNFLLYRAQVSDMMPRVARLQGMLQSEGDIRQAESRVSDYLTEFMYTDEDANAIAVRMQQNLRSMFSSSGLTVSGSGIRPAKELEGLTRVGLTINAEGELEQLEETLRKLSQARPLVIVESLDVQPKRRRGKDTSQEIEVRIQLYSMKFDHE
ncbi:type II secretion system protein GspM [Gilvimarinus sp. SDUM040013]|uniref:Type II secretion system protein GspM n=1 Tax=Gilvimarinus gilvus TaxID=3058038 RepID=A0ABU4RWG8_9GAMM|nr:type II secretion system protein GspM [Gilvimarinus sp. SDUM040013]MDO3385241.1 type II secretion system protein GspM [Gilvimarinus sp. SDUM040013]MDX6849224.1 type II secretion system protein GspM [Gilvimarinus sp. SDUM040013]